MAKLLEVMARSRPSEVILAVSEVTEVTCGVKVKSAWGRVSSEAFLRYSRSIESEDVLLLAPFQRQTVAQEPLQREIDRLFPFNDGCLDLRGQAGE